MKANRRFRLIVVGVLLLGGCESQRQLSMRPSPGQTEFFNQDKQWIKSEKVHGVSVCLLKKMIGAGENASFLVYIQNRSSDMIVFGLEKIAIASLDGAKQARVRTYDEIYQDMSAAAFRMRMRDAEGGMPGRNEGLIRGGMAAMEEIALKTQTVLPGSRYGGSIEAELPRLDRLQRELEMTVTVGEEKHVFRINVYADGRNGHEGNRRQDENLQDPSSRRSASLSADRSTSINDAHPDSIGPPPHTEEHRLDMAIAQEKLRCIQLCRDYGLNPEPIMKGSEEQDAYYQRQYGERWRERVLADWQHDRQELERYLRELAARQPEQHTQQQK